MADKFRVTFPIPVSFADGEQPTALKLNSIASQAKNGLLLVERALGDLWNQAGDVATLGESLQIANLSRAIGKQLETNATMPRPDISGSEVVKVVQDLSSQEGSSVISLDFRPSDLATIQAEVLNLQNHAAANYATVVTRDLIASATDFYVDQANGLVYLGSPLGAAQTITLELEESDLPTDGSGKGAFNVIPYPAEVGGSFAGPDWNGLKFVKRSDNKYLLFLPPRRPLANKHQTGKIPGIANNSASLAFPLEDRFWYIAEGDWSDVSPLSGNQLTLASKKHYRYRLTDFLYERITTSPVTGEILPSGSLYLWNNITNTIVEGVSFKIPEIVPTTYGTATVDQTPWVIQIEGAILDNLLEATYSSLETTDNPGDYKSAFSLIVAGEGLADKTGKLAELLVSDERSTGLSPRIEHSQLKGLQPDITAVKFPATKRANDDHPHLLSREGSSASAPRDRYNNAILGDLLLASTDASSDYQNLNADSNGVAFGSVTTGPKVYLKNDVSSSLLPQISGGNILSSLDALTVLRSHLYVEEGALWLGSTKAGLTADHSSGNSSHFKLVGHNGAGTPNVSQSKLWAGALYAAADYSVDDSSTPNDEYLALVPSSSSNHTLVALGQDLEVLGTGDLVVSSNNLVLTNESMYFGSKAFGDRVIHSSNTFSFENAGVTNGAVIEVGAINLTSGSNQIQFGNNDYLSYDDATNTWEFFGDGNGEVRAANITAEGIVTGTLLSGGGLSVAANGFLGGYLKVGSNVEVGANITAKGDLSVAANGTLGGNLEVGANITAVGSIELSSQRYHGTGVPLGTVLQENPATGTAQTFIAQGDMIPLALGRNQPSGTEEYATWAIQLATPSFADVEYIDITAYIRTRLSPAPEIKLLASLGEGPYTMTSTHATVENSDTRVSSGNLAYNRNHTVSLSFGGSSEERTLHKDLPHWLMLGIGNPGTGGFQVIDIRSIWIRYLVKEL